MSIKTLAICASASTYPRVVDAIDDIRKLGLEVILPMTARQMMESNQNNIEFNKNFSVDSNKKAELIRGHFSEIEKADAILVMNYEKNEVQNYIGANVLIEMSVAFFLKKPIYILNSAPADSPLIDEILGMQPIFLQGDLSKIL
jgi:phosphatidylglycerophosphatase A